MNTMRAPYDEVYVYTMGRLLDAFALQTANDHSRPIGVVFGVVGLYLQVERHFSGR
jgi:hypothetical protein